MRLKLYNEIYTIKLFGTCLQYISYLIPVWVFKMIFFNQIKTDAFPTAWVPMLEEIIYVDN